MESKVLKNVNRFGKIGNVIITILIVVSIIATIAVGAATVFVMTLPKDAVVVSVRENVEIRVNKDYFGKLWNALTDGFAYSSSEDPADIIGGDKEVLPPENQELQMKLKIIMLNIRLITRRGMKFTPLKIPVTLWVLWYLNMIRWKRCLIRRQDLPIW